MFIVWLIGRLLDKLLRIISIRSLTPASPLFLLVALYLSAANADQPTVKIGWLIAQTGDSAAIGEDCRLGMELGKDSFFSQQKVEFIIADSKDSPSYAISEVKKMISIDRVAALVSHRSNIAMPLNPISHQAKIPLIGLSAHPLFVLQNPYAFRVWTLASDEGALLADIAWRANKRTIASITLEDEYLKELSQGLLQRWSKHGGKFGVVETVDSAYSDWSGIATKLLASKPDVIMANVGISQLASLLRKLHELGNKAQVLSNFWVSTQSVINAASEQALEGVIFPQPSTDFPAFREAIARSAAFKNQQQEVSPMVFNCYLAVATIAHVVNSTKGAHSAADLQHGLEQLTQLTISGMSLPVKNREVLEPVAAKIIMSKKIIPLN